MKRKILIVEDHELNRIILRKALHEEYDVLEAVDGIEALQILDAEYKHLSAVCLDLIMPRMGGIEVLERMRRNPNMAQIPVIVATSDEDVKLEKRALSVGANDFVKKPYDINVLLIRLKNTINLREQAAIVNAAKVDALTKLYSRSAFFDISNEMIAEHEAGYYVMSSFDIDKFRVINDQYGTNMGDTILKNIARILEDGFGENGGICCRIMADNYALLYPKTFIESGEISEIHKRIQNQDGLVMPVSFSIGRYIVEDVSLKPSAMYDRAVMAKESIKGLYGTHIGYYEESMRKHLLEEQQIISEMEQALANRQFEVWYQPQMNHMTETLIGAEALVRWRHPERGLISPGIFIPLFEKNGFVYELDKYVWEEACIFLKKMLEEYERLIPVSVNISRYDLFREDLIDVISNLIEKYQLPVSSLCLEITESAFANSANVVIDVVKRFKELGFTVEIDDFGSGFSSLNMLKDVKADVLKLDMKFLENESNSERGGNIVESMIRMARWIGMSVIAEGVEMMEQADFLASVGCKYIQGYLYSKPLQQSDYENIIREKVLSEKVKLHETVEIYDIGDFWDPKSIDTLIFNSFVGGASVFEYVDGNVEIIRVNKKFTKVLCGEEIAISDALAIKWTDYMDEETYDKTFRVINEAIQTGQEISDEMKLTGLRGEGSVIWIHASFRVIARTENRYLFYCVMEDMTEQHETQTAKTEAFQNLQMILDYAGSGITAVTVDGEHVEYLFSNDRYYELMGYTREQFWKEGEDAYSRIIKEDRDHVFQAVQLINHTQEDVVIEFRVECRNGDIRWIRRVGTRSKTLQQDKIVQLSFFSDITNEKTAEEKFLASIEKLKKMNQNMKTLVDDIPGGFGQLRLKENGKIVAEEVTENFCRLIGMTRESVIRQFQTDIMWNVHSADIQRVTEELKRVFYEKGECKIRFRIRHKDLSYISVIMSGYSYTMDSGETGINAYYTDITQEANEDERNKELLENIPCGAGIFEYTHGKLIGTYQNQKYWKQIGKVPHDISNVSALDSVQLEDKAYLIRMLQKGFQNGGNMSGEVHILGGSGEYIPFHVTGNIVKRKNDTMTIYAIFTPIPQNAVAFRSLLPSAIETMMASSGEFIFIKDRSLHYVCASRSFAYAMGITNENEMIGMTDYDICEKVFADRLREEDQRTLQENTPIVDSISPIPSNDGVLRYACISKYPLKDKFGNNVGLYGVGRDITENKEAFEQLRFLTDSIPGGLAKYEIVNDRIRCTYMSDGIYKLTGYSSTDFIDHNDDAFFYVTAEDRLKLLKQLHRLNGKALFVSCVLCIEMTDGTKKWIDFQASKTKQRDQIIELSALLYDVTEKEIAEHKLEQREQEIREKYNRERQLRNELIRDSIYYYQLNLSTGVIEEYHSLFHDVPEMKQNVKVNERIRAGILRNVKAEDQELVRNTIFGDALYQAYKDGKSLVECIFRRLVPGGEYHWIKAEASIMEKPDSGDIVAFLHSSDIDTQHLNKLASETVLKDDVETVICIKVKTGQALVSHVRSVGVKYVPNSKMFDFFSECQAYAKRVEEEEQKVFLEFFNINHMEMELQKKSSVSMTFQIKEGTDIVRKEVKGYYLDKSRDVIVLSKRDVTETYMKEQARKEEMMHALEKANAANRAKSEFLASMSHDIRTPLNAVLAFSNKEMTETADENELHDYLQKVNRSGQYLLSIINDVLDMSTIEQRKIVLNPEPYSLKSFKDNTIIRETHIKNMYWKPHSLTD